MDDYKEHLRGLALHDERFLDPVLSDETATSSSVVLGSKTAALVRVAATIAVDAAPSSFQHAVAHALAAGALCDEIVATLEAVVPVTGAARVVSAAPKLALALGYDVEDALEQLDP
jgi:4-carboxymuconolactone decarboxylase